MIPRTSRDAKAGRRAGLVSLSLGGLSLLMVLPMLPWVGEVMSAERYASVPDPSALTINSFMLAPVFGIAAAIVYWVAGQRRRAEAHPDPDLPATAMPDAGRGARMTAWGFGLGMTSVAIWVFVVLESLSQSGAP